MVTKKTWNGHRGDIDKALGEAEAEQDLSPLDTQLIELERRYVRRHAILELGNGGQLKRTNAKLWKALLRLAKDGLTIADRHRPYFTVRGLMDNGLFWYRLCMLIGHAALDLESKGILATIPQDEIETMATILVEVAAFSTVYESHDMRKRNMEGLGNLLLAAGVDAYEARVREHARIVQHRTGASVEEFVGQTIARVRQVMGN